MAKFIVKNFTVTNDFEFLEFDSIKACGRNYPTCTFTLDVFPIDKFDDSLATLLRNIHAGETVRIDVDEYSKWVDPFKEEFKEFLIKNYPEKIMTDQDGFNTLFGK